MLTRDQPDGRQTITGPGIASEGSVDIQVGSWLPSAFLAVSAVGLAATIIYLYVAGLATPLGAGIGLMITFYNANWARNARPQPRDQSRPSEDG